MRAARHPLSPVPAALVAALVSIGASLLLASCVTTRPQQFRTFLVPPSHLPPPPQDPPANPPRLESQLYANEAPVFADKLPLVKRPSDADFLIKKAEDRFAAGKRALAEHRLDDAREEFNKTIEILLGAPENLPERPRVERRLEELAEGIYRYDLDRLSADSKDKVSFDKSPRDTIPELTFPVDPSLRNKVKEQIAATASQLPLEESDAVVSYVNFFSSERGKRILVGGIRRSGRYKAIIERALREEGLPPELII